MGLKDLHSASVDKAWLRTEWKSSLGTISHQVSKQERASRRLENNWLEYNKKKKQSRRQAIKDVLHDYSQTSLIHGIVFIGKHNLTRFERGLWVVAVAVCGGLMCHLVYAQCLAFAMSPVVMRITSNDVDTEEISFPAVTICPDFKLKPELALETLLKMLPGRNMSTIEVDRRNLKYPLVDLLLHLNSFNFFDASDIFMNTVLHESYNFTELDSVLVISDFMRKVRYTCYDLLQHCVWRGIAFDCCQWFRDLKTSLGHCISFNSKLSKKNIKCTTLGCHVRSSGVSSGLQIVLRKSRKTPTFLTEYREYIGLSREHNTTTREKSRKPEQGQSRADPGRGAFAEAILDATRFVNTFRWETMNRVKIMVHDRKGYPDVTRTFPVSRDSTDAFTLSVSFVGTTASPGLERLNTEDRRCVLSGEVELSTTNYYTQFDCILECKLMHVAKQCGCRPYFAHPRPGSSFARVPECKLSHISCFRRQFLPCTLLGDIKKRSRLDEPRKWTNCSSCLPRCEGREYTGRTHSLQTHRVSLGSIGGPMIDVSYDPFRAAVMFRRSYVVTEIDFLVTIGGLTSLCLGCSLLSQLDLIHVIVRVVMAALGYKLKPIYHAPTTHHGPQNNKMH